MYIINYIKRINFKKILIYCILLSVYILGFIYLNNKINKKETPKIENIVTKEEYEEKEEQNQESSKMNISTVEEYIFVDIKGAVKKPGVYKLNVNSRVIDAINISGGLVKNSNTEYINLSKVLKDSEIIKVYTNEEVKKLEEQNKIPLEQENSKIDEEKNHLININKASKEELKELNGIGDAKAESIIEYRNTIGKFKSIDELKNVDGISETIFDKIKNFITV